jgi:hypothetical protein
MTYTRETLLAERRASTEREIASLERQIQRLRKEIDDPKDPTHAVFGNPKFRQSRKGDGSRENPLDPLAGTSLGEAIKAAIALANDNPLGPSQWIKFNDQVFYVNPDEDLKDVALRVEYVRKTLFPTEAEYLAMR